MKNYSKYLWVMLCMFFIASPQVVYANMAAPEEADMGSSITFEKNEEISVLSETIDIRVQEDKAEISATYKMKNTTDVDVSTKSMFLSQNIEDSGVSVMVNNKSIEFISESYHLNNYSDIQIRDWQYVVLTKENNSVSGRKTVDTITFEISFKPQEEVDVAVTYSYQLGGYPRNNSNIKRGEIKYFLSPAQMWKNFSNLTINLYLDEGMPILKSSNLNFEKVKPRIYQFKSDTIPVEICEITIDENWWQNIWSSIRNPYLSYILVILIPVLLILISIVLFIKYIRKKKKF